MILIQRLWLQGRDSTPCLSLFLVGGVLTGCGMSQQFFLEGVRTLLDGPISKIYSTRLLV